MDTNNNQILETKDALSTILENTNKIFIDIKKTVPQYHQSITNIQQEYIDACENFIATAVKLQQEYAKKTGIVTTIPQVTQKIIQHTTDEFINAVDVQNQAIFATIDTTQQNIKTLNASAKSFSELLNSWFSTFIIKK